MRPSATGIVAYGGAISNRGTQTPAFTRRNMGSTKGLLPRCNVFALQGLSSDGGVAVEVNREMLLALILAKPAGDAVRALASLDLPDVIVFSNHGLKFLQA